MPTIKQATKDKLLPAKGDRPTLQVWHLTMEDGTTAEMLRKTDSPPPTGEVTTTPDARAYGGAKAKLVGSFNGSKGKSYEADPKGLRSKNASMAVAYAKDLVVADKIELGQLSAYAEKFYSFIEERAKVDS